MRKPDSQAKRTAYPAPLVQLVSYKDINSLIGNMSSISYEGSTLHLKIVFGTGCHRERTLYNSRESQFTKA